MFIGCTTAFPDKSGPTIGFQRQDLRQMRSM
jgi:hypothetical protein